MKHTPIELTVLEKTLGLSYFVFSFFLQPTLLRLLPLEQAAVSLLNKGIATVILCFILRKYLGRSLRRAWEEPGRVLLGAFTGFIAYLAGQRLMAMLVLGIAPDFSNANDSAIADLLAQNGAATYLMAAILAPVCEELLYRSLLFDTVAPHSRVGAYCLSIGLFAFAHVVSYVGVLSPLALFLSLLQYIPGGLCLCWALHRTGTVLTPILIHMAINHLAILFMR